VQALGNCPVCPPLNPALVRELCLVVDLSAQSRHVRTLSVGLVWSGRRQSPWVRVAKFDTDRTLPETWSHAARTYLVRSGPYRVVEFSSKQLGVAQQ